MDSHKRKRDYSSNKRDYKKTEFQDVDTLLKILRSHSADYKERNYAAKQLCHEYNNSRVVDALLKTVESDPRVRYQALVSLREIKTPKAEKTFLERLNDPSARIRHVSILGLGDIGTDSAIQSLTTIIETNDFCHLNKGRGGGKGRRTNWGLPENVLTAKEARDKIHQRLQIETPRTEIKKLPSMPIKFPVGKTSARVKPIPDSDKTQRSADAGGLIFPFYPDTEITGDRNVNLEMAKQYELNFIGRIEDKLGKKDTIQKILDRSFFIENITVGKDNRMKNFSQQIKVISQIEQKNLPENKFIVAKLIEKNYSEKNRNTQSGHHFYHELKNWQQINLIRLRYR
jgi:hypothetical protein